MTHIVEIILMIFALIVAAALIYGFFLARSHILRRILDNKRIDD